MGLVSQVPLLGMVTAPGLFPAGLRAGGADLWGGIPGLQVTPAANRGLTLGSNRAGPWSTGLGDLSCFLVLPALYQRESIYFSSVAGLPPLTWTLLVTAETVWRIFGSLGLLQIINHLQHLYFFFYKIEVGIAMGMMWRAALAGREGARLRGKRIPALGAAWSSTSHLHGVYAARIGLVVFA